ncbi:MAG TPA: hydantoinase B/oxoprolinase family protein, partial [Roseiarcus sp.]|nr:hydantoinase B/oxoprolinase family protein [Roseiarcus sp.]
GYTRSRIRPWGLEGGAEGTPNYVEVIRSSGERERYSLASGVIVNRGDVIRIVTGNGGGYGPPQKRDATALQDDIRDGYITPRRAKDLYAVES